MAASAGVPTKLTKGQVVAAGPVVTFDTDTFVCLPFTGAGSPDLSKSGLLYIADLTAANPEVSYGSGQGRVTLTGTTVAFDGSLTNATDWSFADIVFASAPDGWTNATGFAIGDTSVGGSDAAHPVVYVYTAGATVSSVPGAVTLQSATGGTIQWTGGYS